MHKFASVKGILPSGMIADFGSFDSHRKACIFVHEHGGMLRIRFGITLYVSSDVRDEFAHLDFLDKHRG